MKSLESLFRQLANVYGHYKETEKTLNDEFSEAQNSGNYSRGYLAGMAAENTEKMKSTHQECMNTLRELRAQIEEEIGHKNDLLAAEIPARLQSLLNSGVHLTTDEWQHLAKRYENNTVASRLLHDVAADRGITLENYVGTADAMAMVDKLIGDIGSSMFNSTAFSAPIVDEKNCEELAGLACAACTKPSLACFETPKTLEEAIAHDISEHRKDSTPTDDDGQDFLAGFGAETNESTLDRESYMSPEDLSYEKQSDALKASYEREKKRIEDTYIKGLPSYKREMNRLEKIFGDAQRHLDKKHTEESAEGVAEDDAELK